MFTGITRGLFPVVRVTRETDLLRYAVDLGPLAGGVELGASIAIDGVCQTAVALEGTTVTFDAIRETLDRTTLGRLEVGHLVSVERSVRVGDEIGGHDVSGHVIGTGEVVAIRRNGHDVAFEVAVPTAHMRYVLPKGFIALDGSSLTVGETDPVTGRFFVHLIPETLTRTHFGSRKVGDRLNVELDPRTVAIVDTVERVLAARDGSKG
jgi:riboflavin synthase